MTITLKELKQLASYAARGTAPANYEHSNVDEALRTELNKMCSSINRFNQNKYDIFEILIEQADEIVPAKVIDGMGIFAEVQQVGHGDKAMFKTRQGRTRAKKFLTQVGLSGVYETFRLDSSEYTVIAHAIGGGVRIDFDRMLTGADNLADLMDILTVGLTDAAFLEVQKALRHAADANLPNIPEANRVTANTFISDAMFKLISVVKAYGGSGTGSGSGAVIFAPPEFIGAMGPDAIVPVGTNYQGIFHPDDIDAIHKTGYINIFRGTPIVEITQSFVDENNVETWIDPTLAYILPTGGERVVKIVLEGDTQMSDHINRDQSIEIMAYKKMGVAIHTYHNWAIYQNTGIPQTVRNPYTGLTHLQ